jgi:predicted transcriptional regulator
MEARTMRDALISIKPKYVDKILNGQKAVEIRTRKVNLQNDARLWIYSTLPMGSIQAMAYVQQVDIDSPKTIWGKYSKSIGITKNNFDCYVNGSNKISAIVTKKIFRLPSEISLETMRSIVPGFHPPQFIKFMGKNDPILLVIMEALKDLSALPSGPIEGRSL